MILCCGEALIDMLPRSTIGGEPAFSPYAGGSVFNSAIAAARLGVACGFFTGLSDDLFGDMLRAKLEESHVDLRHALFSSRPTTLAFVTLTDGQADYRFYDENTAGRMIAPSDIPLLGEDVEALLFGGISLVSEPCGSAYEALMQRESAVRVTMLDPNIRPAFIGDPQAHRARIARMIALADIVKISADDLAWFEEPGEMDEIAIRWLDRGPRLVIITDGGKGATAYSKDHRIFVPAHPVQVVDTVGAGDTFNGALLAALSHKRHLSKNTIARQDAAALKEAIGFAARAAAVTVSRAGANPPWKHELG
ncbi:fructokinase [Nitratireductor indicus C115]|uniref:Fructokinase n=1 Tax=Nitratireductor indicus C115 TaxID=1231190 RepID=K2MZF0_9HYPH|nr:carbohydrate kinase [Nitratireductor indicus]EKF40588.1 fructokinase [Nitratireductor indicus C115]SFQ44118.1 fructokinase [Nitratireductor indicus]